MFAAKRHVAVFFALCLLALSVGACIADATSTSIGNLVTDVLVGHNNKGPYVLSWTAFDADSVSIVVNGQTLKKNTDYNIDASTGLLSFNSNVAADAIIRVSYQIIDGKSKQKSSTSGSPLALNIFSANDSDLKITSAYATSTSSSSNPSTIIGVQGDKQWGSTKFSSTLLTTQSNDSSSSDDSTSNNSALKIGSETNIGKLKFTGSLTKAGEDFAGEKQYGITKGASTTGLAASFAPDSKLQLNAKYNRSDNSASSYSSNNEQSLNYSPTGSTSIALLHSFTESATATAGSNASKDTSSLKLSQNWGKTSAVASMENNQTVSGSTTDEIQSRQFSLASSAFDRVSLSALMSSTSSEINGDEQKLVFGASAKPITNMNVDLGFSTLDNDSVGHQTNTNVKVSTPIAGNLASVQAAYNTTDSSTQGQTSDVSVSLKATPANNLQLQGKVKTDSTDASQTFQRDFSLSSAPTTHSKITASLSQNGTDSDDNVTKGATLELTPLTNMKLSAGYKYAESGTSIMNIYDYAASAKPLTYLSLSGSVRNRESAQSSVADTTAFQLALSPIKYFSLTGDYKMNPEDTSGNVQSVQSTTVGMTTHIGSISLLTNFTETDQYSVNQLSNEQKFGIEMPAFGHGTLSTAYKQSKVVNGSETELRTYSFGYSHKVGSDFSLSLSGYYTQYLQDKLEQPDKDEYSAEASIGFKF